MAARRAAASDAEIDSLWQKLAAARKRDDEYAWQVRTLTEAQGAGLGGGNTGGSGAGLSVVLPDSAATGALGALGYVNTLVRGCTSGRRRADGSAAQPKGL